MLAACGFSVLKSVFLPGDNLVKEWNLPPLNPLWTWMCVDYNCAWFSLFVCACVCLTTQNKNNKKKKKHPLHSEWHFHFTSLLSDTTSTLLNKNTNVIKCQSQWSRQCVCVCVCVCLCSSRDITQFSDFHLNFPSVLSPGLLWLLLSLVALHCNT